MQRIARIVALLSMAAALSLAAGPAEAQKIKLGSSLSPPSLESISPYVAIEKGFFKKNGVDAEVVEFRGDATHVKALLSGDIDASINMGATEAIVTASKKAPIKLWVVANPTTPYYLIARKEAGTTLQALVGKNVAVSGIGAISYHIPRIVFERSGVDPEKFKYVAVGSPADRFKAMVAGKVDVTVVTTTEVAKLDKYPDIIPLVNVPKVVPEIPYEFGMAKEDWLAKNADKVQRMTKAIIEAILPPTGFDDAIRSTGVLPASAFPSRIVANVAMIGIILAASVEAARQLGGDQIAIFLAQVTALGGKVIFGTLIIVVGIFLARIVANLVGSGTGEGGFAQTIVRYAIIALFTAIGLTFMGLADAIVMMAFGLILGSAAVATALAFGLGGRDAAARILERWADVAPTPPRPAPPRRIRGNPAPGDEQPPLV